MSKKTKDSSPFRFIRMNVWGNRLIEQALISKNVQVHKVMLQEGCHIERELTQESVEILRAKSFSELSVREWDQKHKIPMRYRLALEIELKCYRSLKDLWSTKSIDLRTGNARVLAFDQVQDPHNVGSMIRSAKYFGFEAVVLVQSRACPITEAVLRSSAGALFEMEIVLASNLVREMEFWKKNDGYRIGLAAHTQQDIQDLDLPPSPKMLILGSEDKGLRHLTEVNCDFQVRIYKDGAFESLNVGVAAGISMYELSKKMI